MVTARIPELKHCGCGVSLSLGAKIVAAVFLTITGLSFITSLYYIVKFEIDQRNPKESDDEHQRDTYKEVIAVMLMVVSGIQGALALLLWIGVKEHKPSYVLPWAILTTAFTIIFTFIEVLMVLFHRITFAQVIFGVIVVALYYCALIVYSYFRELRREKNLPQTLSNSDAP